MATKTTESERERLSRQTVTERALAIADGGGLASLTIRGLTESLGVTAMALYWHFRNKDELLAALAERVWSEVDTSLDPAAPWPAQLRRLMQSYISVLRAHAAAPDLLMRDANRNQPALRVTEAALTVLLGAGFDPDNACAIARSGLWTGITLVISEPGKHPGVPDEEKAEYRRRDQLALSLLPASTFPHVVECAAPLTACDDPEFHYRLGIDMYIAAAEAIAAI
ncbi:MAG TPA: TetR/AcrR family transcriptional regulator [Actinocrinis sp.]